MQFLTERPASKRALRLLSVRLSAIKADLLHHEGLQRSSDREIAKIDKRDRRTRMLLSDVGPKKQTAGSAHQTSLWHQNLAFRLHHLSGAREQELLRRKEARIKALRCSKEVAEVYDAIRRLRERVSFAEQLRTESLLHDSEQGDRESFANSWLQSTRS